jgi:dipeptidyl aminopeptidase/acylaminoacyl peptidase
VLKEITDFSTFDINPVTGDLVYASGKEDIFRLTLSGPAGGKPRILVEGDQQVTWPVFSPDGRWIAYTSDFDGNENSDIFVMPARGGRSRNLTANPADDRAPTWAPDGKSMAFISNRNGDVENVFVLSVASGRTRQLTRHDLPVSEAAWQPGARGIAYTVGDVRSRIGLADASTGKAKTIMDSADPEFHLWHDYCPPKPWSPDGSRLAFLSGEFGGQDIGILDLKDKRVSWLARDDAEKAAPCWSPDGRKVAYTEYREGNSRVVIRALSKRGKTYASPAKGFARHPTWRPRGGLAFLFSSSTRPEEIWFGQPRPRAVVRNQRPKGVVQAEHIRYKSFDGRSIPAMIYVPKRRNGAAVVIPHGGPEYHHGNSWRATAQFFATRGYVVMDPNYRGSTGYGRAFRKLSDRDLGGGDMRDVNEAARYLLRKGLAKPGRIGIWGVSYGGYLALHCPTQEPELWSAAVPVVGFFDWETCYDGARTYLRTYDIAKMGDVRKEPERFKDRSPVNFLYRLRAPVLLFAGANDPRCPAHESRRVAGRIKAMGIPTEYVEYPDEGHYPRRTSNEIDLIQRSLDFVERHLGGGGKAKA